MIKKMLRVCASTAVVAMAVSLSACSSPSQNGSGSDTADTSKWATALSAEEGGGLAELEKAANAEGQLNVIALPHNWSNYGEVIEGFKKKYPAIKINELNPNASSADELKAAQTNKGTDKAPDVFDLGIGTAVISTDKFAPYKVAAWDSIPDDVKESSGLYYGDYTGVMTLGYNKTKYGTIDISNLKTSLADPKFKNTVALNGKPSEAGSAANGFLAVNLNQGGSITHFQPGLDFFAALKEAGTLTTIDVTDATIDSGQTGVVFDWSYNQVSTQERLKTQQNVEWTIVTLPHGEVEQYYNQAISKDAPHPAAARLWEEYLYTADVQNAWLRGGAIPALYATMQKDGSLDQAAAEKLPAVSAPFNYTASQADAMTKWLAAHWDKTIG
ncbi:MAG: ABC transporter substrate-binding protein [Actinomycetaceae bacterium]|nr:ABC transporter substrate-binding protein [Arcanobacterium sp.]MDD7686630.1 ABC transporter substrate-binding protein [Actinomycetaceae bacterium]MDY5273862.1 ABC transporter substrate-binding protein [Arcanobacterium sp.]